MVIRSRMEPKCKLCTSPHRVEIEQLFVKHAKGEPAPDGSRLTRDWIVKHCAETWGMYLSKENIDTHLNKHFQLRKSMRQAQEAVAKRSTELLQSTVLEDILDKLDVSSVRKEIIARGLQKIREVDGESITPDHVLKALEQEQKDKTINPLDALMDAAANAVNFAVDTAKSKAAQEVDVVIDLETEDAEVEE